MADFDPQIPPAAPYFQPQFQVSDMLVAAYRMAHALKHPGQGLSPSESVEGLQVLNALIDGWKIETLLILYIRRTIQTMNPNQGVYGVGPGQDFDLERPEHIRRAGFIIAGNPNPAEEPMENILTAEQWARFVVKDMTSTIPLAYYYQAAVPNGAFRVWPVPSITSQIAIYTPQTLSEFSTVDDTVILANGFREMLQYNLAVKIHELYPDKPMASTVMENAIFTKARVKNNLITPLFIGSDGGAIQNASRGAFPGGNPRAWTPYD